MGIEIDINDSDMRIEPDGDLWAAYCDKLGIDSFGSTKEEAGVNLWCALALYFKSLMEKGILFERMQEKGVNMHIIPTLANPPRRTAKQNRGILIDPVLVG